MWRCLARGLHGEVDVRKRLAAHSKPVLGVEFWRRENAQTGRLGREIRSSLKKAEKLTGTLTTGDIREMWFKLALKNRLDELVELARIAEERNVVIDDAMYYALLKAMAKERLYDDVIRMYKMLREKREQCVSLKVTIVALNSMAKRRLVAEAEDAYKKQLADNFHDLRLHNAMMHVYALNGKKESAETVWKVLTAKFKPNLRSFNVMLKACCEAGDLESLRAYFRQMNESKITPNLTTYSTLLDAYKNYGSLKDVESLLPTLRRSNFIQNEIILSDLMHTYAKSNRVKEAEQLMEKALEDGIVLDAVPYSILIQKYVEDDDLNTALRLFEGMKKQGVPPTRRIYSFLLDALLRAKRKLECMRVADEMADANICPTAQGYRVLIKLSEDFAKASKVVDKQPNPSACVYTSLLDFCAKRGDVANLLQTLKKMEALDFQQYVQDHKLSITDALLMAYARQDQPKVVQASLSQLKEANVSPSPRIYAELMAAQIRGSDLAGAEATWKQIRDAKPPPTKGAYELAVRLFATTGKFAAAERVLHRMKTVYGLATSIAYSGLLRGYAKQHYFMREILAICKEMEMYGVETSEETDRALMIAAGRRMRGRSSLRASHFFDKLRRKGLANTRDYNFMIATLARKRMLQEAKDLLQELEAKQMQPDQRTHALRMMFEQESMKRSLEEERLRALQIKERTEQYLNDILHKARNVY